MSLSSSSFANEPQNCLFIDLGGSQSSYTAGDHIHGRVRVDPKLKPAQITLIFKGYSVIYNKNASGLQLDLFKRSLKLFTSMGAGDDFDILRRGTAQDGRVELPFDFTFPQTVQKPPPSDRKWHHSVDSYNHPRFQHSPGFPLPPTSSPPSTADNPLIPRIVYHLEARMESSLLDEPSRVRQELHYIPSPPDYHPMLLQPDLNFGSTLPKHLCHYKLIRTRKLYPNYHTRSKASKLRDTLVDKELFFGLETSGEIPYARFNYFATPARVLVVGGHIPITMTVQHLERSESLVELPSIFLRRVRVQLLHTFQIFVPNLLTAKNHDKESIDSVRNATILMDKKFEKSEGRLLIDGLKLSDFGDLILGKDNHNMIPSFTSYGLSLEYEIQVDIWAECAEREFSGLACKEKVQVVSDYGVCAPLGDTTPGPEYHELDPMGEVGDFSRIHELPANEIADRFLAPVMIPPPVHRPAVPPPPYQQVR